MLRLRDGSLLAFGALLSASEGAAIPAAMSDRVFFALSVGIALGLVALALVWP